MTLFSLAVEWGLCVHTYVGVDGVMWGDQLSVSQQGVSIFAYWLCLHTYLHITLWTAMCVRSTSHISQCVVPLKIEAWEVFRVKELVL